MYREKQYIRKVTVNWKLRKNIKKEEWEQASALSLKRKAEGKLTELTILGKIIPDKKRKKEIRRYAPNNLRKSNALIIYARDTRLVFMKPEVVRPHSSKRFLLVHPRQPIETLHTSPYRGSIFKLDLLVLVSPFMSV